MHRRLILLPILALAATGCETARLLTDRCDEERVEVVADVSVDGAATTRFTGVVTEDNLDPTQFAEVRRSLATGTGPAGRAVVWNATGAAGTLSVHMPAALAEGAAYAVSGAPAGGGWGVVPAPAAQAGVLLRTGALVDRPAAVGTLTVLSRSPVRVRVHAQLPGGALVGDATFTARAASASCS